MWGESPISILLPLQILVSFCSPCSSPMTPEYMHNPFRGFGSIDEAPHAISVFFSFSLYKRGLPTMRRLITSTILRICFLRNDGSQEPDGARRCSTMNKYLVSLMPWKVHGLDVPLVQYLMGVQVRTSLLRRSMCHSCIVCGGAFIILSLAQSPYQDRCTPRQSFH